MDRQVLLLAVAAAAGPLLGALPRTTELGFVTLGLEQKVHQVRDLLSTTRGEMARMDGLLAKLSRTATEFNSAIDAGRTHTRAVQRTLRAVDVVDAPERLGLNVSIVTAGDDGAGR